MSLGGPGVPRKTILNPGTPQEREIPFKAQAFEAGPGDVIAAYSETAVGFCGGECETSMTLSLRAELDNRGRIEFLGGVDPVLTTLFEKGRKAIHRYSVGKPQGCCWRFHILATPQGE